MDFRMVLSVRSAHFVATSVSESMESTSVFLQPATRITQAITDNEIVLENFDWRDMLADLKQVDNKQRKTVASKPGFCGPDSGMNICLGFLTLRSRQVLRQNPTIQKFITVLMLLVFTISVAPRSFFHDLVADHRDIPGCSIDHKIQVVHKQGFNCHFDDLVVSAPFVLQTESHPAAVVFHVIKEKSLYYKSYSSSFLLHKENRGPPAV